MSDNVQGQGHAKARQQLWAGAALLVLGLVLAAILNAQDEPSQLLQVAGGVSTWAGLIFLGLGLVKLFKARSRQRD